MKIFKTGTFADSLGRKSNWTTQHLAQMVFHYNLLRATGSLKDVLVRAGHAFSVEKIAGYIVDLRA